MTQRWALFAALLLATITAQTWTEQAVIVPNVRAAWAYFGTSLAITDNHALVGVPDASIGSLGTAGTAYIFSRTDTTWTEQVILTASDKVDSGRFGQSVSITDEYAVVGSHQARPSSIIYAGAVYIFTRSAATWSQHTILTASNMAITDQFGVSVSVTSSHLLAGASYADPSAIMNAGAAYIFVRSESTWTEQAILTASMSAENNFFGSAVSLSENYAVVGARNLMIDSIYYVGAAFVFARTGTTWTEQAMLTASDKQGGDFFGMAVAITDTYALIGLNAASRSYFFSRSGSSWTEQQIVQEAAGERRVAMSEHYAIIGNKIYTRSGSQWEVEVTLSRSTASAVAITDHYAMVSDRSASYGFFSQGGEAYIFLNQGTPGGAKTKSQSRSQSQSKSQSQSLSQSSTPTQSQSQSQSQGEQVIHHRTLSVSGSTGKSFGHQVAFSQDFLVISKHECDPTASSRHCGRVYVLKKQSGSWTLTSLLRHPGDVQARAFGKTLVAHDGWLFISAESITNPSEKSSVFSYMIEATSGEATPKPKLVAPASVTSSFGRTLATDGSFVAVGAPLSTHANGNQESGVVVIYQITNRSNWGKQGSIIQPSTLVPSERFGSSLAINQEGVLAIGNLPDESSHEAVYIYHLRNRHLFVYQKLQLPGRVGFGKAIAFWQDILYISAPDDSSSQTNGGSVHTYQVSSDDRYTYSSEVAVQSVEGSRTGSTLCVCNDYLLVSQSVCIEGSTCSNQGKVLFFEKDNSELDFMANISHGSTDGSDRFGASIACTESMFAVGAPQSGVTFSNGGAVHIYTL